MFLISKMTEVVTNLVYYEEEDEEEEEEEEACAECSVLITGYLRKAAC